MEVKSGIITDGVLHELVSMRNDSPCDNCSLQERCNETDFFLCTLISGRHKSNERFVNRGKVKIEKEEK